MSPTLCQTPFKIVKLKTLDERVRFDYDYVVSLTVTCLDSVAVTILSRRLGR